MLPNTVSKQHKNSKKWQYFVKLNNLCNFAKIAAKNSKNAFLHVSKSNEKALSLVHKWFA